MIKRNLVIVFAFLSLSTIHTFAIEGLQLSVQSSNVVLAWPSTADETYIVQYRPALDAGFSWLTLTNYFLAAPDTNVTFFTHSNIVQYPPPTGGGTNGGGSPLPPMPMAKFKSGTSGSEIHVNDASEDTTNEYAGFYRVVRDGVHLWGITNGMIISNVLVTTIEFAVDSTDQVVGVTFYDMNSASPIIGASGQSLGGNRWLLVWNTTLSFNGDYAICAQLNFASDPPVTSQPVTVTVDNVISFPNYFSQVYGGQMWIYAVTIPNAPYELDMYDENTNYLGTFEDYADSTGTISFLWNLVDANNNFSDSTNFVGVFTVDTSGRANLRPQVVSPSGTAADFLASPPAMKPISAKFKSKNGGFQPNDFDATASSKQLWVKEPNWTPNDNWVVAYAPLTDDPTTTFKEENMMLGTVSTGNDGVLNALANDTYSNLSPGNTPNSHAFELVDSSSRDQLLNYLADSRYENFYFFGHGDDSHISAYQGTDSVISSDQIAYALGNVPLSYNNGPGYLINTDPPIIVYPTVNPSIQRAALHPYRFVFLDGCGTAMGNFCESFGIPAVTVTTNFFAAAKVESRAFVGYTKSITFNAAQWDWRAFMIVDFLQDWRSAAYTVQDCMSIAKAAVFQPMDSSATIYGAVDMKANTRTRP